MFKDHARMFDNFYTFIFLAHTVSHKEVSDQMVLANQGGIKGKRLYFNYK